MSEMKITYHGHACFSVEAEGFCIVLDPCENGTVPGLADLHLQAQQVLCSHEHHDHNGRDCVKLLPAKGETPFRMETLDVFHDDRQGALRGANRIHVLSCGGLRLAHLGDLGHALSAEQVKSLGRLDAILIPVGGFYTVDAVMADRIAAQLGAPVVIPMHYRSGEIGYEVLGTAEEFLSLRKDICRSAESSFVLRENPSPVTLLLTPDHRKA